MRVASPSRSHLCRRLQQFLLGAFDEEVAVQDLRRGQQKRDRGFERGRMPGKYCKRYRTILTQGGKELPEIPRRRKGKRGRVVRSFGHNLHDHLLKYEDSVLRFMNDPDVGFTNNTAEQKTRMSKVKIKVSGCFRTERYAHAWCRIPNYLDSMAELGYNPIEAILIALDGNAADMINLNSAVGAKQSSGKLLMLNQCLCLESSTMANPSGEAR